MSQNRNSKQNLIDTARKVFQDERGTKKLNPVDLYYIGATNYCLMLSIPCHRKTYGMVGTENNAFDFRIQKGVGFSINAINQ